VSKPLVAAESELSEVNACGDDHIDLEQVKQSNKDIVGINSMTAGTNEGQSGEHIRILSLHPVQFH
jgi:hypothetical protein